MAARANGRRVRRGVAGTAVAAAAMAALSASQAPNFFSVAHAAAAPPPKDAEVTAPPGPAIDGGSPYITEVPPLNTPTGPPLVSPTTPPPGSSVGIPAGTAGLPATVLAAYQRAAASVAQSDPGCHLPWQLLAAIGQVESGQARRGAVDANGTTYKPILGPVLNGNGFASISDTDGGRYDGDPVYDRAVGPMQFIPSTWAHWGADGNGDGAADPNNVYDAALAAAHYLCADGRDLAVPADMDRAILGYNHSQAYLTLVRAWYEHFVRGTVAAVPDRPGSPSAPGTPGASGTPSAPSGTGSPTGSASTPPTPPGSSTPPTKTPPSSGPSTGTGDPTGGTTTAPPTDPTTPPSSDPTDPTTPPSSDPTDPTSPTTPPTTPGCETSTAPSATDTPTGSASPTPSDTPTDDPCVTDSPTPDPSDNGAPTAGEATAPAA